MLLLKEATEAAEQFIRQIEHTCDRIAIAGSVRRGRPEVNDIDLVVIEKAGGLASLKQVITTLGPVKMNGEKIKRLDWWEYPIDIYIATLETWATLLLIRTGSSENNIRLCTRARDLHMHLSAGGQGLFNAQSQRIAGDTEESIYEALQLPYQDPVDREV